MLIRIIIGIVIGGLVGLGANYLCMATGAVCPLIDNRVVAIVLCALIGGLFGAVTGK